MEKKFSPQDIDRITKTLKGITDKVASGEELTHKETGTLRILLGSPQEEVIRDIVGALLEPFDDVVLDEAPAKGDKTLMGTLLHAIDDATAGKISYWECKAETQRSVVDRTTFTRTTITLEKQS